MEQVSYMRESNVLANAISKFVKKNEKRGLVEIPLPTGFGKTHAVMQAISMMTDRETSSFPDVKRIIFTTTLKKNLPIEKLKNYYTGDFEKEVLLLKSNVDSLIDFHACGGLSKIPDKFKNDDFNKSNIGTSVVVPLTSNIILAEYTPNVIIPKKGWC